MTFFMFVWRMDRNIHELLTRLRAVWYYPFLQTNQLFYNVNTSNFRDMVLLPLAAYYRPGNQVSSLIRQKEFLNKIRVRDQ